MNYNDMKFYTVEEVAVKLRVSQNIIMELIENRILEAVNVGNTGIWIVEEQAILEMLIKGSNRSESNGDVLDKDKKELLEEVLSNNFGEGLEISITRDKLESVFASNGTEDVEGEEDLNGIEHNKTINREEINVKDVKIVDDSLVDHDENAVKGELNKGNSLDFKSIESDPIVILKSDIIKHKDGDYVAANKLHNPNEEKVIAEFIFDAEQAKKPVTDEIVLSKLSDDDNVHICDDQEANERLLRLSNQGKKGNFFEEKKRSKSGKRNRTSNFNKEIGRKIRKNFVIDEELIEKLQSFRDNTGESMSNIVEDALAMYFKANMGIGQAL